MKICQFKIENGQKMSQTNHCLKTIWKLLKKLKTFVNKLKKSYEKWGEIEKLRGKTFEKYVFKNVKKNLEKYFFNMRLFVGFSNTIHKYFIWFSQLALFVGYCVFPCQSPLLLTISTNSTKKPKSRKKSKPNGRKHHGKMPREVKNQNLTKNPSFHRVSKSKANDHCIFFKSHTLQYTPKQSPFLIFKKIYI